MLPSKHLLGAQKRNKRKLEEQLIESQRGALHIFFQVTSNAKVIGVWFLFAVIIIHIIVIIVSCFYHFSL